MINKPRNLWTPVEKVQQTFKAKYLMISVLSIMEYNHVCNCGTAKEV